MYQYIKAAHIIFIVTWFSGIFYLCRLYVYHAETQEKKEPEKSILQKQFLLMSRRLLYAITLPSAILTLSTGTWLFTLYQAFPIWLMIKITIVMLLVLYHASLHVIYRQQSRGLFKYDGNKLRIWNEMPTLLLVAIVMLAVVKNNMSLVYGIGGLAALITALLSGIKIYKKIRGKKINI